MLQPVALALDYPTSIYEACAHSNRNEERFLRPIQVVYLGERPTVSGVCLESLLRISFRMPMSSVRFVLARREVLVIMR